MNKNSPTLDEIFSPRGVAVVGVSATGRGFANGVLASLIAAGFPAIYPINPRYQEVMGMRCYPSLQSVPGVIDHVVVSIPAESALSLLDDCAAKGVKSVHFFTAGFSESGLKERAELEKTMLEKAHAGGFRIVGPNCIGLFVPRSKLVNTIGVPIEPGPIAFISQSGGHASNLPIYGSPRGLRFSKVVSYGNGLDIGECELLEYFAQDPETEIIAAYIEGVRNGRRFVNALRTASARKPVVIYKGGTTEAGKRAAHGHTASLTSSVAVFEALCHQMNVIRVDDLDEMVDVLVALHFARPLPAGTGTAVIGAGGGPSVLASDELEKAGLQVPALSKATQSELLQFLPLAGSILINPIDAGNLATPEAITATMRVVSRVPDVVILLYHLGFHPISSWGGGRFASPAFLEPTVDAMDAVRKTTGKIVVLALRPPLNLNDMKDFLAAQDAFARAGLPVFHSLRQAGKALAHVIAWQKRRG
ncbi:MAG: CoA-binding protein [Dehalococcoidia bacterium]|nr:CoA-binding protein [Dehalococcoidia bacterium]